MSAPASPSASAAAPETPAGAGQLRLFVDAPLWDLPTSTPQSLEPLIYARLAGIPFELIQSRYPYHPATESLPAATYSNLVLPDRQIVVWMKENWCDLDKNRTRKERGVIHAIRKMASQGLGQVLLAVQWADPQSMAVMRRMTATAAPGVLRLYLASQEENRQRAQVQLTTEEALVEARRIYTSLADLLDDNQFFFGDYPTSADAAVAAQLAVHLSLNLDGARPLREMLIKEFPSLVRQCWTVCREAGILPGMAQVRGLCQVPDEAKANHGAGVEHQPLPHAGGAVNRQNLQPQLPRPAWRRREAPVVSGSGAEEQQRQYLPKKLSAEQAGVAGAGKPSGGKELMVFGGVCLAMWLAYRASLSKP